MEPKRACLLLTPLLLPLIIWFPGMLTLLRILIFSSSAQLVNTIVFDTVMHVIHRAICVGLLLQFSMSVINHAV